jgi:hypothetical protein
MKNIGLSVIIFIAFSAVHPISKGAEATLCSSDEVVIASCHLNERSNRIVSFCASADKINYRFGSSSKMELIAVFSSEDRLSRWVDRATYTVYLGFERAKYSYVFGVPQETLGAKAFLDVSKHHKNLMSAECTDNSFGEKDLVSQVIQEVEDNFVRDNGFIFPSNDN